jgi:hypothetical protein
MFDGGGHGSVPKGIGLARVPAARFTGELSRVDITVKRVNGCLSPELYTFQFNSMHPDPEHGVVQCGRAPIRELIREVRESG